MQLKPITHEGIPAALQKAERYRLLNDSSAAESITITDNAIIPLKERVVDRYFDPIKRLFNISKK